MKDINNSRGTLLNIDEKHFAPEKVETGIYGLWEQRSVFKSGNQSDKKPFSIVIPPPNVTGRLHMGHALNTSLQDILIRYKRMDGFDACWVPGTDHAGISTQSVVKKQLQAEGHTLKEYGRENTIRKIWEWKAKYGDKILEQLRKLGCSCDWSRTQFTMSPELSVAVREAFVRLYEAGLIYRGRRIVNWCPIDQTALSNDETYTVEDGEPGHLWYFKYPLVGQDGYVTIATTRPETMFGDVAVAVHPQDPRYAALIGSKVLLPLMNKEIPIIGDDYVDQNFGTGCLKITPAHDPNDFEIGERHGLTPLVIMDPDAHLNKAVPERFWRMERYAARNLVVSELKEMGLLEKVEDRNTPLVRAERSKVVIEYFLSDQWFVRMKPLAEEALKKGEEQGLSFFPARWALVYRGWLENVKDWCISRQIWWGHRIPAWYHKIDGRIIVSRDELPVEVGKEPENWVQEQDVLDTWFSSALWPYSTFGWPNDSEDLKRFYPTDVVVTGKDIIYLWIARMVMMGMFNLQQIPFHDVLINPIICDENGDMMSKSKGNGIDPLHIMDGATLEELEEIVLEARPLDMENKLARLRQRYPDGFKGIGADALRFSLASLNIEGQQANLSLRRFEEVGRPFTDKLWNACRFVINNLKEIPDTEGGLPTIEDNWILGQLDESVESVRRGFDSYRIDSASESFFHFFWDDFCDWYVELAKSRLKGDNKADRKRVQLTLFEVLSTVIRTLHPIVPFITEELWGHLHSLKCASDFLPTDLQGFDICATAPYPKSRDRFQPELAEQFEKLRNISKAIRSVRVEAKIAAKAKISANYRCFDPKLAEFIEHNKRVLIESCGLGSLAPINKEVDDRSAVVVESTTFYLDLAEFRDTEAELLKARKALENVNKRIVTIQTKLANSDFVNKAPLLVIEKEKAALNESLMQRKELDEILKSLSIEQS
jgi:valyl-tRNA synthetase